MKVLGVRRSDESDTGVSLVVVNHRGTAIEVPMDEHELLALATESLDALRYLLDRQEQP